ncbi:DNA cross-link repair 1A protein [Amia ocellicauda]|uniref:DNA cross-link repair 1A protein n=1 Tax=Amia ocellicauda TaxID=2972642 RepID=UPI0034641C27
MPQDGSEDDIWEYKSLRKPKALSNTKPSKGKAKQTNNCSLAPQKCLVKSNGPRRKQDTERKSYSGQEQVKECAGVHQTQENKHQNTDSVEKPGPASTPPTFPSENDGPATVYNEETQLPTISKTGKQGHCPSCQMPFSILLVQSPRWHVAECLDTLGGAELKECPDGLQCTSTIPNHYKRYSHFLLAQSRAISDNDCFSLESSQQSSASSSSFSSQNFSPSSQGVSQQVLTGKSNALLLLKSPTPEDIHKKKGWSPKFAKGKSPSKSLKSQSSQKSQECRPREQFKTREGKTSEEDLKRQPSPESDGDISYSPLCSDTEEGTLLHDMDKERMALFGNSSSESEEGYSPTYPTPHASREGPEPTNSKNSEIDTGGLDEDLSNDDLFAEYFNQEETKEAINTFAVDSSSETDRMPVVSLAHNPQVGFSNSATAVNLSQLRSSTDKGLREASIPASGRDTQGKNEQLSPSPQSLVLDCLRDQISRTRETNLASRGLDISSINVKQEGGSQDLSVTSQNPLSMASKKNKAKSAATGLKQTDIGVFFGLKPLKTKEVRMEDTPAKVEAQASSRGVNSIVNSGVRKQRKRKATGSLSDSRALIPVDGCDDKNGPQTQVANGYRPKRKRWNRGMAAEEPENARRCPFYKKIPGTAFVVDAFQYGAVEGISGYFLTHFHSDHYGGLTKHFRLPIYCNKITGNLVKSKLRVEEQYVNILPMNTECTVEGVRVTLVDANHCPGAAMLLFHLPNSRTVLHTGDFRADPSMERYPELLGQKVQTLYLDTTYCSPEYTFPTQQETISFAANIAFEHVTLNPRTLVVCGTYSVGKEKVFLALAEVLGCKVSMSRDKYNTLCCLESDRIKELITTEWNATQVHVLPMMQVNFKNLSSHLKKYSGKYEQILAFKPTGWTFSSQSGSVESIRPQVKGNITIYGIPYSEHSSYLEMKRFVQWLRPEKIIPTVNVGSWQSRKAMENLFAEWMADVKAERRV